MSELDRNPGRIQDLLKRWSMGVLLVQRVADLTCFACGVAFRAILDLA